MTRLCQHTVSMHGSTHREQTEDPAYTRSIHQPRFAEQLQLPQNPGKATAAAPHAHPSQLSNPCSRVIGQPLPSSKTRLACPLPLKQACAQTTGLLNDTHTDTRLVLCMLACAKTDRNIQHCATQLPTANAPRLAPTAKPVRGHSDGNEHAGNKAHRSHNP